MSRLQTAHEREVSRCQQEHQQQLQELREIVATRLRSCKDSEKLNKRNLLKSKVAEIDEAISIEVDKKAREVMHQTKLDRVHDDAQTER